MEYLRSTQLQTSTIPDSLLVEYSSTDYISSPISQLDKLFPNQATINKVEKNRKHLGELNELLSEEQLQSMTSDFQFLIDAWLDQFETEIFGGMTLQNLLKGK